MFSEQRQPTGGEHRDAQVRRLQRELAEALLLAFLESEEGVAACRHLAESNASIVFGREYEGFGCTRVVALTGEGIQQRALLGSRDSVGLLLMGKDPTPAPTELEPATAADAVDMAFLERSPLASKSAEGLMTWLREELKRVRE